MARRALDRRRLIQRLPPIEPPEERPDEEGYLQRMSLSATLLSLARIDHEAEFELVRSVARHLLGRVHEPDDFDEEEE